MPEANTSKGKEIKYQLPFWAKVYSIDILPEMLIGPDDRKVEEDAKIPSLG